MSLELDIPSLLAPFDGESRCGVDLREDDDPNNLYRKIRDARKDARDEETNVDLGKEGASEADAYRQWREVWSNGQEYLQTVAKDLEIIAYMIESSVRLGGVGGLAQSLELTRELVENFWGELLPTPDEDGIETTLLPIIRLNGDAITYPLLRVPMTADTSVGVFVLWQHTQAKQLDSMSKEEQDQRIARGAVTSELFNRAVAETPDDFYISLSDQVERAAASLGALNDVFLEKAGQEDAPNLSRFSDALGEIKSVLKLIAGDRLSASEAEDEDTGETESTGEAQNSGGSGGVAAARPRGEISSRDDAIEALEKVAVWFERNEPQSILPAEIRKAKRRARMSPTELYMDLISDEEVRSRLFKDVGIEAPVQDESY